MNCRFKMWNFFKKFDNLSTLFLIFCKDISSSITVDLRICNTLTKLLTLYAFSSIKNSVAFVSHYPKSPKESVILYDELSYTCSSALSLIVFSAYFVNDIITHKKAIGPNSGQTYVILCNFINCVLIYLNYWESMNVEIFKFSIFNYRDDEILKKSRWFFVFFEKMSM